MAVILLPQLFSIYGLLNTVVYHLLAILAFTSHLRAMLTDPVCVAVVGTIFVGVLDGGELL